MVAKIFSQDELDRALPLVRVVVADVRDSYRRLRAQLETLGIDIDDPELDRGMVLRELPWDVRDELDGFRDLILELEELGLQLRDPETGLVESYGERGGEIVFFSWMPGESRIQYWHELRAPRTERRPLPSFVG